MIDDLRSDDGLGEGPAGRSGNTNYRDSGGRPVSDREVPIGQDIGGRVLAPAIHAWLDGELPEAAVRRPDTARVVELWNAIAQESEIRRRAHAPRDLELRIMGALPQTVPARITPWWSREFVITPAVALATLAGVAIFAAMLAALLAR
jgi:hypothetical protein